MKVSDKKLLLLPTTELPISFSHTDWGEWQKEFFLQIFQSHGPKKERRKDTQQESRTVTCHKSESTELAIETPLKNNSSPLGL